MNSIPVIIPCFEPDDRLLQLLSDLRKSYIGDIIIVDDGSAETYRHFFDKAKQMYGCIILRHYVNMGKGRALKTAFNYCLIHFPNMLGCVTADSDGQHTPESIKSCIEALEANPNKLILGCRNFDAEGVPDKSRLGNKITRNVCKVLCGVSVTDTQTGLRAIPHSFMEYLLTLSGERFEFETNMLIATKDLIEIVEITIETIYDSKENHSSHFNPVKDSIRIYKLFGKALKRFILSSLSSGAIDFTLFAWFCAMSRDNEGIAYVVWATIVARIISATYNYFINYYIVFKSNVKKSFSAVRYCLLAFFQMFISAGSVAWIVGILPQRISELAVKIPIDILLFFVSFIVQREFVYRKRLVKK